MSSILSLIIFLLRLTLLFEGPLVQVFPAGLQGSPQICAATTTAGNHVDGYIIADGEVDDALIEVQEEEEESRHEKDQTSFSDWLGRSFYPASAKALHGEYYSYFTNKPKQGNLHLYDVYESWKIYLS